jgi:hypothetical protein
VKYWQYGGLILCCLCLAACPQEAEPGRVAESEPVTTTLTGNPIPSFDLDGMEQSTTAGGQLMEGPRFASLVALYDRLRAFKGYDPASGLYCLDTYDPFPHLARMRDAVTTNPVPPQYTGPTRYIMAGGGHLVHIFRTVDTSPRTGGIPSRFGNDAPEGQDLYTQSLGTMRVNNQSPVNAAPLPAYPWYRLVKPSAGPDEADPPAVYTGLLDDWKTEVPGGEDLYWSYRASRAMLGRSDPEKLAGLRRALGYSDYDPDCWLGPGDTKDQIRRRFSYASPGGGLGGKFGTDVFAGLASRWGGSSTAYSLQSGGSHLDWSKPMTFDGLIPLYVFLTYVKYLHGTDHGNGGAAVPPAWPELTGYRRLSRESLDYIDKILDLIEGNHHSGEAGTGHTYDRYSFRSASHHASYGIRNAPLFLVYDELFYGAVTPAIADYVDVTW